MGQYMRGDVLLAPVALDSRSPAKARPVIVISTCPDGTVHVCPVSSRPPTDAPSIPLGIDDFENGGLDLFEESYIMTSRVVTLRSGQVIGKRGRLTKEALADITGRVPDCLVPGDKTPKRKTGPCRR